MMGIVKWDPMLRGCWAGRQANGLGHPGTSGYFSLPPQNSGAGVATPFGSFFKMLEQLRYRQRRRLFLKPPFERRRPLIAAEDYAARHSIEHTLDRKAELRRLAPSWPPAARRYYQLLTYELDGLREVMRALPSVTEGRELEEALAETTGQIQRLEIE